MGRLQQILLALVLACGACESPREVDTYQAASEAIGPFQRRVTALVEDSACMSHRWTGRGRAPAGYVKGMALSFAKSLCRVRLGKNPAELLSQRATGDGERDALTWYQAQFDAANLDIDRSGADVLLSLYTLGIGHGMRESAGKHCQGVDPNAESPTAVTAEAGLFQTSYNSSSASSQLRALLAEYRRGSTPCFLEAFLEGVSCPKSNIVGTVDGGAFQKFAKSCPAFAAEYAMLTLRVLRKHYGPINRREAEIIPVCAQMLESVRDEVERRPGEACDELL